MANDETPLSYRILAALGGMRDAMTPEDVKAVQRFARWIGEAESALSAGTDSESAEQNEK